MLSLPKGPSERNSVHPSEALATNNTPVWIAEPGVVARFGNRDVYVVPCATLRDYALFIGPGGGICQTPATLEYAADVGQCSRGNARLGHCAGYAVARPAPWPDGAPCQQQESSRCHPGSMSTARPAAHGLAGYIPGPGSATANRRDWCGRKEKGRPEERPRF